MNQQEGNTLRYEKHIFICSNERAADARVSCGEGCGLQLVAALKKKLKDRGLTATMRAQRAGCFDLCEEGPNMVVYPEGVFYGRVTLEDLDEVVEEHLVNNRPVKRLQLHFGNHAAE